MARASSAAAIRGAKDPVAALQAEFPNRANDASAMIAAGKAYSDQVKAGQQTTQSLEERGVLPVIVRTAENKWTITTKDGGSAHFPDWQSANAARWQHAEDNHLLGAADATAASTYTDSPAAPEAVNSPTENGRPNTANAPEPANQGQGATTQVPKEFTSRSGTLIKADPHKTTTILGGYLPDMAQIIHETLKLDKSMDFGPKVGGYNVLNIPDDVYAAHVDAFWEKFNRPWIDKAIERGDNFYLATPPTRRNFTTDNGDLSGFGKEYEHMLKNGYTHDPSSRMRVRNNK